MNPLRKIKTVAEVYLWVYVSAKHDVFGGGLRESDARLN